LNEVFNDLGWRMSRTVCEGRQLCRRQ
jgi:hypothetical protein